ncbi:MULTISPECIES: hypothetical protein [Bacillus]|nr:MULTISPECIES: hypothetical protein [Bacillus]WHF29077.1 hypothetical protein QJS65_20555 [Bacillus altitudinis]
MQNIYKQLLEQGWRMKEIDEMDIYHFLELNASKTKEVTIDQIF